MPDWDPLESVGMVARCGPHPMPAGAALSPDAIDVAARGLLSVVRASWRDARGPAAERQRSGMVPPHEAGPVARLRRTDTRPGPLAQKIDAWAHRRRQIPRIGSGTVPCPPRTAWHTGVAGARRAARHGGRSRPVRLPVQRGLCVGAGHEHVERHVGRQAAKGSPGCRGAVANRSGGNPRVSRCRWPRSTRRYTRRGGRAIAVTELQRLPARDK